MRLADIRGNRLAVDALRSMADTGRVPHAMLFYENPSSGALSLAVAWIQYLCCEHPVDGDSCGVCPSCRQMAKLVHPDVHYVFPVNTGSVIKNDHPVSEMGLEQFRSLFLSNPYFTEQALYDALGMENKVGNISVHEAKNIVSKLSLSALAGGYKAVVMFLPERMNVQAANKLLKILEEPPQKTIFVLITQNPDNVLSTIFSRCQGLRVLPFEHNSLICSDVDESLRTIWDNLYDALCRKDLLDALNCADELGALKSREKQKVFCTFVTEQIRRIFMYNHNLQDIAMGEAPAQCERFSSKFCMKSVAALDNAVMLIGRNVSPKIVFTDLVNRLYVNL